MGMIYLIAPIIPPNIGLNVSPKNPDFVYINTIKRTLIISMLTTAISMLTFGCFFLPLFALAISTLPSFVFYFLTIIRFYFIIPL